MDYYTADVQSAQDFYPFGFKMPGRTYNASNYRYGFNGKEEDDEVKGDGNEIDYGMRVYDTRIGRFLSVDPLTKSYPHYTPYSYAGNKPINCVDLDGLEEKEAYYYEWTNSYGQKMTDYYEVLLKPEQQRPEFGNKGTLTHIMIQAPDSYKWTSNDAYTFTTEKSAGGLVNWFKGLFGAAKKVTEFQLVIFGSGHEDPKLGPPIDYSKPFATFDFNEFQKIFDIATVGMKGGPGKPTPATLPGLIKKWGEAYIKQMEYNKMIDNYVKEKEKQYDDPGSDLAPNESYRITPNVYPATNSDNVGETIVRTGENGQVKDTIKYPSLNQVKRTGSMKPDTVPNRKYVPPQNVKKF